MLPVLAAASFWGDNTVLAAGFPGETAQRENQFQTLTDIARVSRSDHVVVVLGGNDCDSLLNQTDIVNILQTILTRLAEFVPNVHFLEIPKRFASRCIPVNELNSKIQHINRQILNWCAYKHLANVIVVPRIRGNRYSEDGVHLNHDGYKQLCHHIKRDLHFY